MRRRVWIVLAVVVLGVAVLGWTPVGDAAPPWVTRALFAKNAGKVNGIKASRTPKPNKLLALDANGLFPVSVIPAGMGGVGPQGPPGPPGPSNAYSKWRNGPVDVPNFGGPIAQLDLPGAGSYVIFAKAWFGNVGTTTNAISCELSSGFERDVSKAVLETPGPQNADQATLALNVVTTTSGPASAVLTCEDFASGDIKANWVKVTAIEVGSLTNTPGVP